MALSTPRQRRQMSIGREQIAPRSPTGLNTADLLHTTSPAVLGFGGQPLWLVARGFLVTPRCGGRRFSRWNTDPSRSVRSLTRASFSPKHSYRHVIAATPRARRARCRRSHTCGRRRLGRAVSRTPRKSRDADASEEPRRGRLGGRAATRTRRRRDWPSTTRLPLRRGAKALSREARSPREASAKRGPRQTPDGPRRSSFQDPRSPTPGAASASGRRDRAASARLALWSRVAPPSRVALDPRGGLRSTGVDARARAFRVVETPSTDQLVL